MAAAMSNLLLLILQFVMLNCSKRFVKSVYRPYGPKMCEELSKESPYTYNYVKEDLSCRGIPAEGKASNKNRISGPKISNSTALALVPERHVCDEDSDEKTSTKDQLTTMTSLSVLPPKKQDERMIGPSKLNQEQTTAADNLGNLQMEQHTYNITLHEACKKGNLSIVKYILSRGLEGINSRGKWGKTPVMASVEHGQARVFDYLLSQGCDLSCTDDFKNNLLHAACTFGNIDIVRTLLVTGKNDIEGRGFNGYTALMFAVAYGHREICDLLIKKKANVAVVNDYNDNNFHVACMFGHVNMVRYILSKNKFGIESRGHVGRTPVMVAAEMGKSGVFDFLARKGCNLKAVDIQENNILHVACLGGHVDMVRYILSKNIFGIESRGQVGRTPVMMAAHGGHREVFNFLMNKGCKLTAIDDDKSNVLHLACLGGHVDMVRYIWSKNILGIESRGQVGRTPVMMAAQCGHREVFDFLMSNGCELTAVDDENSNVLHLACLGGHVKFVRYLLTFKPMKQMMKAKNKSYMTPKQVAERNRHRAIVSIF